MKIVITQEDVKNSGDYKDSRNCPMAQALKKALNIKDVSFCFNHLRDIDTMKIIGKINPSFMVKEYNTLIRGEIKEFVTEYTPL